MCLRVLDIPEDFNPKITTEDIPCYKLLLYDQTTNRYKTPCQNFPIDFDYEKRCYMVVNEMTGFYYAEQMSHIKPRFSVSIVLNWVDGKHIQSLSRVEDPTSEFLDIHAGIHAYLNSENISTGQYRHLFKAVIPKGAHYFIGTKDEIVADKMIIFDEDIK